MKLYELTQNYLNLQELLDNPDIPQEMIISALNEVNENIEDKMENTAKLIKSMEGDISGLKTEEDRLSKKRKVLENRVKSLKTYIEDNMRTVNKKTIKGKFFNLNIQKNKPSVDIFNESLIPKEYWIEQVPIIDKKLLLSSLQAGEEIMGASIKQTESLRIR